MSALSTLLHPFRKRRGKRWNLRNEDRAWFDRPDALEILDRGREAGKYDPSQYDLLKEWTEQGCFVVDDGVEESLIDAMVEDLDRLWTTDDPVHGLVIEDLRLEPSDPAGVPHEKLVQLDLETRRRLRDSQHWRIHGFPDHSSNAREIFESPRLGELCALILDRPADPRFAINFMYGSQQQVHQDMAVFHIAPLNYLIGVWIACEDVSADGGPLVYYPGSHREGMFDRFDNYPQTNLKTCDKETTEAYERWIAETREKYPEKIFLAKKGQVFFWHGMLLHGGIPVVNPKLTRKSFVCHFIPDGMNKEAEIEGPFNW